MKQWIILTFLALVLISCNRPEKVVEKEWKPGQPKLIGWYLEEDGAKYKTREEKYYEDGKLEYEGSYDKDGLRHGEWKYYYQNGNLWSLGNYEHGRDHGKKKVYWPEGNIRYEGFFSNDQKSGHWIFYNMDGTVLQEMDFDTVTVK